MYICMSRDPIQLATELRFLLKRLRALESYKQLEFQAVIDQEIP